MNKINHSNKTMYGNPLRSRVRVITMTSENPVKIIFLFALSLLLFFGVMSRFSTGSQAAGPEMFTLKGLVQLIDGGKIKRKIRVPSFENVEAPVGRGVRNLDKGILGRNIFAGTGEAGNLQQIYMRDSFSYTEIIPVIFLHESQENGWTKALITKKRAFSFADIPAGNYEITISVPGYTPVVKNLLIAGSEADDNNVINFPFSFTPSDKEETRLLKAHYNPESIPDKARADYNKGVKAINEAKLDEALIHLEIALERASYFTEASERMGLIYLSRGKMEEAEKAFRMAVESDLYSYRSLSNLGTILLNKGENNEASELHRRAVKMRPQDPQARYHLAMALFQLGDLQAAIDQLAKEKALDASHYTQPQLLSAEIYRNLEDFDSMIREIEEFLDRFTDDPKAGQVRQALADARELMKEMEE
ncbi:MAG: tetratricopeptide repeat protein [Holophagae bacterium]|nr:tetratricopeptide repeat protein [Holophagae bacterium]